MTVEHAIQSLRDFTSKLDGPVAPFLRFAAIPRVVEFLHAPELEGFQARSNQEWMDLIEAEDEPVRAATLFRDWYNDQMHAEERQPNGTEFVRSKDESLKA